MKTIIDTIGLTATVICVIAVALILIPIVLAFVAFLLSPPMLLITIACSIVFGAASWLKYATQRKD